MMFKPPRRFIPSSFINETDEVRAKHRRDLEEAVYKAVPYLGADEVERIVHDIAKGQRGNTPKEERNARILAKYYSVRNKSKAVREYIKEHPEETFGAADDPKKTFKTVYRQLGRLLEAEAKRERWKAESEQRFRKVLQRLGGSFVGSADAASDSIPNSLTNKRRIKRCR
jgi:hypothetical protein